MSRSTQLIALAAVTLALASAALAVSMTRGTTPATFTQVGPGMMGGYRGMMGGGVPPSTSQSQPSSDQLATVRDQVDRWLAANGFRGFGVAEVMAFTSNDYVAVHDARARPAFELLVAPGARWLMEEPPSMMWNTRYGPMGSRGSSGGYGMMSGGGMMSGNWNGGARAGVVSSTGQAIGVADRWLAQARPGEQVDREVGGMGAFPGYYTLDTTRGGRTIGMVSVNAATGAVWYHTWHGRFLAERDF